MASEVKLPDITTQSIYAGKYKDWSPDIRPVSIVLLLFVILCTLSFLFRDKFNFMHWNSYKSNATLRSVHLFQLSLALLNKIMSAILFLSLARMHFKGLHMNFYRFIVHYVVFCVFRSYSGIVHGNLCWIVQRSRGVGVAAPK